MTRNCMTRNCMTRREALAAIAVGTAGVAMGCSLGEQTVLPIRNDGRLAARPRTDLGAPTPGLTSLRLGNSARDGVLYVPEGVATDHPVPLIVMLHGAGGSAGAIESAIQPMAEETGAVILATDSRGTTWDVVRGGYGDDIVFLNAALEKVFGMMSADPSRIAIAGFSDGASYSLGVGCINGDLFSRILAFSPGFIPPVLSVGTPAIYISHGTSDQVLPIDLTSRLIVENLMAGGYDVTFRQFNGGHVMSAALVREAFGLVVGTSES